MRREVGGEKCRQVAHETGGGILGHAAELAETSEAKVCHDGGGTRHGNLRLQDTERADEELQAKYQARAIVKVQK